MATTKKTDETAAPAAKKAPRKVEKTVSCAPYACLNVREEASAASKVVKTLENGEKVSVEAKKDGWHRLADGSGYVKAEFLA